MSTLGTVAALTHFPVKSTAGESLSSAEVDLRGLTHDRRWAIYTADGGIGSGKTTRRFRKVDGLLRWRSTVVDGAAPVLHTTDGASYAVDHLAAADALSAEFGQLLVPRPETTVSHHDESGIHLVTTSSLRTAARLAGGRVDVRRLRANIVLDTVGSGFVEDDWIDRRIAIGPDVILHIGPGMPRCVMMDQPQHEVPADVPLLRVLGHSHDTLLGAQAAVACRGTIAVGDVVRLRD